MHHPHPPLEAVVHGMPAAAGGAVLHAPSERRRLAATVAAGATAGSIVSLVAGVYGGMTHARWAELAQVAAFGVSSALAFGIHTDGPVEHGPARPVPLQVARALGGIGMGFFASVVLPGILSVEHGDGLPPTSAVLAAGGLALVCVAAGAVLWHGNRAPAALPARAPHAMVTAAPAALAAHALAGPA